MVVEEEEKLKRSREGRKKVSLFEQDFRGFGSAATHTRDRDVLSRATALTSPTAAEY